MKTETVTPKVERRKGGMPRWAFLMPYWTRIDGKPFVTRFIFFFTPWGGCHITWIRQADNQREYPHDHSATFASFKLLGSYDEDVFDNPDDLTARRHVRHRWLGTHVLKHTQAHSITRVSRFTVMVLFLGRRRQKSSYWTPGGLQSTGMKMDEWS